MAVFKRQRADGREYWQVKIRFGGRNGKQISRNALTQADAKRLERELLDRRDLTEGLDHPDPTIHELSIAWWHRHVKERARPATREVYQAALDNRIIDQLGDRTMSTLSPAALSQWAAEISQNSGARTTNQAIGVLKTMLKRCLEDGLIATNPAESIRRLPENTREAEILTPSEVRALAVLAPTDQDQRLILSLAFTGLRVGELLALEHTDIREDHIRVTKAKDKRTAKIGQTKTRQQRRVPLLNAARESLQPGDNQTGPVFKGSRGSTIGYSGWSERVWRPLRVKAKRPGLRLHDLRHTFASVAIDGGASPVQVARWLGHADPSITLNTYAHLFDRHEGEIIEKLNAIIDA